MNSRRSRFRFRSPLRSLALVAALGASAGAPAAETKFSIATPVQNFSLRKFTDDGLLLLRGNEALQRGNRIEVVEMNLNVFSGGADSQVETIILSPVATFIPAENLARGDKTVRLLRGSDMDITGEEWVYDHARKKVTIARNTRVVFHAPLPDLLR